MDGEWKFFFPDDGETDADALPIATRYRMDALAAAEEACEYDLSCREGYLHIDEPFAIVVLSPEGERSTWEGRHEATVVSSVSKKLDTD